jgi:tetratricopeptide (TPR) repeat protein
MSEAAPFGAHRIAALERHWAQGLKDLPVAEAAKKLLAAVSGAAPPDIVAIRRLARLVKTDDQREALLNRAVALAPDYDAARLDLAIMLLRQQRHANALPHFARLADNAPDNAVLRASLAMCLGQVGEYDKAIEFYRACAPAFGRDVTFAVTYADTLKYAGRRDECVAVLRGALKNHPGSGLAWWALANVKTEIFAPPDIAAMCAQVDRAPATTQDRYHLHYALGRAFERQGDYARSFTHYAHGAALRRADIVYDEAGLLATAARTQGFFTAGRVAALAGHGCKDAAPIFILGMPRAGSTLVEQILARHSRVEGTMELPEIAAIARACGADAAGTSYPDSLAGNTPDAMAACGRRYIDNTKIYRRTGKPYFTDKMPSNWLHVGLIHAILPNAKIIDVRRHPVANCLAAFKQLFGQGVGYSYDLGELARYYAAYAACMAHVDTVLPGRVHRLHYENLVNDTETEIRSLLAYCGLEFEPACLRFWESGRAVATPSAEQVRRPMSRDGLESWRHYAPWLEPLSPLLNRPNPPGAG